PMTAIPGEPRGERRSDRLGDKFPRKPRDRYGGTEAAEISSAEACWREQTKPGIVTASVVKADTVAAAIGVIAMERARGRPFRARTKPSPRSRTVKGKRHALRTQSVPPRPLA